MTKEQESINYIRRALYDAKGDDLESAERTFKHCSPTQLQANYGYSDETCQQVLDRYREDRKHWQEAFSFFEELVKGYGV